MRHQHMYGHRNASPYLSASQKPTAGSSSRSPKASTAQTITFSTPSTAWKECIAAHKDVTRSVSVDAVLFPSRAMVKVKLAVMASSISRENAGRKLLMCFLIAFTSSSQSFSHSKPLPVGLTCNTSLFLTAFIIVSACNTNSFPGRRWFISLSWAVKYFVSEVLCASAGTLGLSRFMMFFRTNLPSISEGRLLVCLTSGSTSAIREIRGTVLESYIMMLPKSTWPENVSL
mmetsp:Transcript_46903/g.118186  ORF Transcript_46903/g.118186 Transcript_46903/m.118186 type:complete len:230 (-) Transcript_46903:736-1425(-)